jgi:hypothetical protein
MLLREGRKIVPILICEHEALSENSVCPRIQWQKFNFLHIDNSNAVDRTLGRLLAKPATNAGVVKHVAAGQRADCRQRQLDKVVEAHHAHVVGGRWRAWHAHRCAQIGGRQRFRLDAAVEPQQQLVVLWRQVSRHYCHNECV